MVRVSDIKLSEVGIKKYFLFYSFYQFFSWLVSIFIVGSIITLMFVLILNKPLSLAPIITGIACALPSVFFARQANFRIEGPWRAQGCSAIEGRLEASGFNKEVINDRELIYRQKMPRFLQWEKSYINIKKSDSFVIITGPYGMLSGLRKFLMTNFSQ